MRNQNPPESGHTYCFTVPEWVAKRITRHYPDGIPSKAMRPFWRRMKNPAYKRHIFERVDDILMETLDETSTEPARWPRNPAYWIRWKIVLFWKIPGKKNCRYLLRVLQEGRTRDFTQPSRFATWFDFWTDGDYQPENNQRSPLGSVVHQLT